MCGELYSLPLYSVRSPTCALTPQQQQEIIISNEKRELICVMRKCRT